jgi:hypothetical protein
MYVWATLYCVGMSPCTPDMMVLTTVLSLALLTIAIAEGRATSATYCVFGALLGAGYLAKTAMLPLAPAYLAAAALALRRRKQPLRKLLPTVAILVALVAPFIVALRVHTGRWTIGESARLNYAWEVCGAPRYTHWQPAPGYIETSTHPTRRLMSAPEVFEFNTPEPQTYAPWYEPSVWYAGVRPRFRWANELTSLVTYGRYSAWLILATPGVALVLFLAASRSLGKPLFRTLAASTWLTIPPALSIAMYSAVFVDRRYVAGALAVIGIAIAAAVIPLLERGWVLRTVSVVALCTMLAFHGLVLLGSAFIGAHDLMLPAFEFSQPSQYQLAQEIRLSGLKSGDHIGYIGLSIGAYWALLDGASIVVEVPVKYCRRGGLSNDEHLDLTELDSFWRSSAATQGQALQLMRRAGATAVVADYVPQWANTQGWHRLHTKLQTPEHRDDVYIRFLN